MLKRLTLAAAVAVIPAGLLLGAGTASAAGTPSIGSGSKIVMPINAKESGACTVAGAGHDKFGNKVALTAGHCGKVGQVVKDSKGRTIGTFATSVMNVNGISEFNKLDYAFIKLNPNVRLASHTTLNPLGVIKRNPQFGQVVCKDGITTGVTCGALLGNSSTEGAGYQLTYFGDSGGPVVMGGKLVGVTSRSSNIPVLTPTLYTFAKNIVKDATAKNTVGAGFVQTH